MFDSLVLDVDLAAGVDVDWLRLEDELSSQAASSWAESSSADSSWISDLDALPVGPYLGVVLERFDRSGLNGFGLVEVLRAGERLVSHFQARMMGDMVEVSYAAPGSESSEPERLEEAFEYASDEVRAALVLTRRNAEYRLSFASDLVERLPRVWELLDEGLIDLARARVVANGTAHLDTDEARRVVDLVAERAPLLTTGQLAAWIRRLWVESDPVKAEKRERLAKEDRRLWIEATPDGTANVHLLDIGIDDAKAFGRRVNGHMFSLRKDGDTRTHDQLRADIATDFLLGADPTNGGKGLVDVHVELTTLAGLDDKAAELGGMGPVIAEIARKIVDRQQKADWQARVTDCDGNLIDLVTVSRRPTKTISRLVDAVQPVCTFPGCRVPARDCDYDHLLPHALGGPTSTSNGGPKCRHDHVLKDHGWKHQRINNQDVWTSPLGHTYTTQKPP